MEKNSKYKIVNYNSQLFIIDINKSKLTYIFPLLNYVIRHKMIEISEIDKSNINISHLDEDDKKLGNKLGFLGAGIGPFISVIGRPLLDYMNFRTNFLLNIFLILIAIISSLFIKSLVDRKKKISLSNNKCKAYAFVLPEIKHIIKNILINIILIFFIVMLSIGTITLRISSVIFILGIMMFTIILSSQNVYIYDKINTRGKIGGVRWRK
ncbi:DUF443 family protein [Staphylococcus argensis]|uniref:DUF443 family protein n=1 Tax=Staphylococcus argensis TaxID=1607738 RepID=UPI0021B2BE1C|nr:DUF443 family protein [Staphylococcus argensis]MCY6991643.1 DUF443 family protein [Staphylococcus argensis]